MTIRTDETISRGMGAAKAIIARLKGLVGVFRTLAQQHGEVSGLVLRIGKHPDKRAELWPKIRIELLSHEKAEMREVYPELRKHDELRAMVDKHDREAAELETAIQRVDRLAFDSDEWKAHFDRLVDLVKQHVEEEEGSIFPAAQKVIGEQRARELEPPFLAGKRAATEQQQQQH
jgi:hemerythrin superfamily protein